MKKVLFIIWSLERGGAERFLAGLLTHLDRTKFEPVLCCLNWKGEWGEQIETLGIKVIALNKKGKVDLKAFAQLRRIIREGEFDIVNTHLWLADTMGRLAAIKEKTPIIVSTAQNVDVWKKSWHRMVDRWFAKHTNMVIAVSQAVKKYYHEDVGIPTDKINVIPNAIDVSAYENIGDITYLYKDLNITSDDFVIACVGRLNPQKAHHFLLESLKPLKSKYTNLKVVIVGKGELKNHLVTLSKEYGVSDIVRFVGHRSDIPQILAFSDALVLPSIFEGLPLCVLEAMASELPVIATDVGGTAELAVDGVTGYIVPPRDPQALTAAIEKLMKLSDQGKALGTAGKKIVTERFSIQAITRQTEQLFSELMETAK